MKPDIPSVLAELAGLIVRNAAPGIADTDRASALGLSAALIGIAAGALDGMAHHLVQENRRARALLGEVGSDEDLHISALSVENARLRQALIVRHTEAENRDPELEAAIWLELAASTVWRMRPGSPV